MRKAGLRIRFGELMFQMTMHLTKLWHMSAAYHVGRGIHRKALRSALLLHPDRFERVVLD
jgi:hypothetical protein